MTKRISLAKCGPTARAAVLGLALVLGGCTTLIDNYGYVPTEIQLQDIEVGTDTKETVAENIGSPPLDELQRDRSWYYVAMRRETYAWRAPEETERQVVAVRFTEGGTVENVERFGLERGQVVTLSRRVTDASVPEPGFLRGLLQSTTLAPNLTGEDI
ncbi:MAG: outer membrane protein assembly factor BamE [Pseudomonadota bacterium]